MRDNTLLRQNARRYDGTLIKVYAQHEGNCRGTVAWWVRSRLQSKSIWRSKYFSGIEDPEEPGIGQQRYLALDHYDDSGQLARTDRGLEKSRALESLLGSSIEALKDYIMKGTRADKPGRPEKVVGALARAIPSGSIGTFTDEAGNIGRSFVEASLGRFVSYFSVTIPTGGHAIGFDGTSSPQVLYIDPNIGEFTFSNVANLIKWWRESYVARDRMAKGAFNHMGNLYYGFHFRRP